MDFLEDNPGTAYISSPCAATGIDDASNMLRNAYILKNDLFDNLIINIYLVKQTSRFY